MHLERSRAMPSPNLFIVGAPKCGTTSMHEYLAAHPDVSMSGLKEPHHFGRDLDMAPHRRVAEESKYLELFAGAGGSRCIGESSTWYLYSSTAAEEIYQFNPDARIIIMLRNPVDAMYSLHGQFLWSCNENIADFAAALAAQDERRQGRQVPREAFFPAGLQYESVFQFEPQVRRCFERFGRSRVHVILFEDFVRDTPAIYRQTLKFLGLDPAFAPAFTAANAVKPVCVGLNRFLARRPGLRRFIHRTVPRGIVQKGIQLVPRVLPTLKRPPNVDPVLRRRLQASFRDDVTRTGSLLGRDLTGWLESPPSAEPET